MIALRMEGLLQWVAEWVAKFPREHRFTVGDRLLVTCIEAMESRLDASYRRDKHGSLAGASRGLVRDRVPRALCTRCASSPLPVIRGFAQRMAGRGAPHAAGAD